LNKSRFHDHNPLLFSFILLICPRAHSTDRIIRVFRGIGSDSNLEYSDNNFNKKELFRLNYPISKLKDSNKNEIELFPKKVVLNRLGFNVPVNIDVVDDKYISFYYFPDDNTYFKTYNTPNNNSPNNLFLFNSKTTITSSKVDTSQLLASPSISDDFQIPSSLSFSTFSPHSLSPLYPIHFEVALFNDQFLINFFFFFEYF
jgi:hypothetical protein